MGELVLRNVSKTYGEGPQVIQGIDLHIPDGQFTVFVGPSGCGKSTMLRMIAGLELVTGGDIMIDGVRVNDLQPVDRGISMVFQSYALYPHMTVAENMGFSLKLSGKSKAEVREAVGRAAEILQILEFSGRVNATRRSDYRAITAEVQDFANALRADPAYRVLRTQLPFDVTSEGTLSGDMSTTSDTGEAPRFTIILARDLP